jgi:hypothetical protein
MSSPESPERAAARLANHEARATARAARYRLMLVAVERTVVASVDALMAATPMIMDAPDRETFDRSVEAVREASRTFVDTAREQVRALAQVS